MAFSLALPLGACGQALPASMPRQLPVSQARMVEVEPGVQVEVLDFGDAGPALVLLAGLGGTAHTLDGAFVDALRQSFHVYGLTRRGYAPSSAPIPSATNYSADRLGDDVLRVLDALGLTRPLLVGHSLAGEELSSIGSRHPERVAGLVYMDAGYRYALSGPGLGDWQIDTITLQRYLQQTLDNPDPVARREAANAFLRELPEYTKEMQTYADALAGSVPLAAGERASAEAERGTPEGRAERAILDSEQRYSTIRCPALVIFAYPHALPAGVTGKDREGREKADMDFVDQRLELFRAQPNLHVLLLPHATHDVQISRRAEVLKAIREFAAGLRPQ